MLQFSRLFQNCSGLSRRGFLEIGTLAGLGVSLPSALAMRTAAANDQALGAPRNCILIWTHGGTSHHDTFDPKPQASASVRGEFGAISTAVPGV